MNGIIKKAGMAVALTATALTGIAAAAPADAQRWGGYRGGDRDDHRGGIGAGGAAVLGGLLGLGVGAAIADSHRGYGYGYGPGPYYGPAYRGYYGAPYGYYAAPRCWTQWRWDPYWGRDVRVRVCD